MNDNILSTIINMVFTVLIGILLFILWEFYGFELAVIVGLILNYNKEV